jgi:UDP-galactopyranose mutase
MDVRYDYLIAGAGLYGATFAHQMTQAGMRCLVIDRRSHTGGNVYCETIEGIVVHKYGAHIFHTSDKKVWDFVNQFVPFKRYTHSPIANYKGNLYNLPFNMNTFYALWQVRTPEEARSQIRQQCVERGIETPRNLEEQAISLVGTDIYERLIKGYTEKQWGCKASELPAFIIKRIPVRFTFDNDYFDDLYQGIPAGGYNRLIDKLLSGIEVKTGTDFFRDRAEWSAIARKIIFTGEIDKFFDYALGHLEYRSLRFEEEILDMPNFQGCAVMNYTDAETPYTRIIEHKHFESGQQPQTVITREYPQTGRRVDAEPYYPVNDEKNNRMYFEYKKIAAQYPDLVFAGRLGEYQYYDMDKVIASALARANQEIVHSKRNLNKQIK